MNHQSKLVKYFIGYFNENFDFFRFPFENDFILCNNVISEIRKHVWMTI